MLLALGKWPEKRHSPLIRRAIQLFYIADLLQLVEVLAALGCGADPRLSRALAVIHEKQDVKCHKRWLTTVLSIAFSLR